MSTIKVKRKRCKHRLPNGASAWRYYRSLLNSPFRRCQLCHRVEQVPA